jgi:hypothetical protein
VAVAAAVAAVEIVAAVAAAVADTATGAKSRPQFFQTTARKGGGFLLHKFAGV